MKGLVAHRAEQDGRAKGLCLRDDGRIIWRQDFSARNMTQASFGTAICLPTANASTSPAGSTANF